VDEILQKPLSWLRQHPSPKEFQGILDSIIEHGVRQLTPDEVAMAYKVLHEARAKEDRRKLPKEEKGAAKGRRISAREQSAGSLNISVRSGDAHELIFITEGVPEEVKKLARTKEVSIVRAGEAVKAHLVDGKVQDPDKLIEAVKALTIKSAKPLRVRLVGSSKLTAKATLTAAVKPSPMHEQIADVDNALEAVLAEGMMVDEASTRSGLTSILNRAKAFLAGMGWSEAKPPEPPPAPAPVAPKEPIDDSIFTVPEETPIPPVDDDFGDLLKSL